MHDQDDEKRDTTLIRAKLEKETEATICTYEGSYINLISEELLENIVQKDEIIGTKTLETPRRYELAAEADI